MYHVIGNQTKIFNVYKGIYILLEQPNNVIECLNIYKTIKIN